MSIQVRLLLPVKFTLSFATKWVTENFGFPVVLGSENYEWDYRDCMNCVYFLALMFGCFCHSQKMKPAFFFFFSKQDMRLNLFPTGQLIEIRTPLHKAWYLRQLSLSGDTSTNSFLLSWLRWRLTVLFSTLLSEVLCGDTEQGREIQDVHDVTWHMLVSSRRFLRRNLSCYSYCGSLQIHLCGLGMLLSGRALPFHFQHCKINRQIFAKEIHAYGKTKV
jgi:hypothetical protein